MRNIYTYLTILMLAFVSGGTAFAQLPSCDSLRIVINGQVYSTLATARATVSLTITQGETVRVTNTNGGYAQVAWSADGSQIMGPLAGGGFLSGDTVNLPTSTLAPCDYTMLVNLVNFAPITCPQKGILLQLKVVSRVNVNGVAISTTGTPTINLGSSSCVALSTSNSTTGATYNWSFVGNSQTTQAMGTRNLPVGNYPASVMISTPGCATPEVRNFNVSIQQSSIVVGATSYTPTATYTGTTTTPTTPSTHAITINQGENISLSNGVLPLGTTFYRWYAGLTTEPVHNLTSGSGTTVSPGSAFTLNTAALLPCTYQITVAMASNGSLACDEGHMNYLVLNVTVRSLFQLASLPSAAVPYTGPVSIPLGTNITLSTATTPTGLTYNWTLNGSSFATPALSNVSLPTGTYIGLVTVTNAACTASSPTQLETYNIAITNSCGIGYLTNNYFGTTTMPSGLPFVITYGSNMLFTPLGSTSGITWATTVTPASITPTTNSTINYTLNTNTLQPCSYDLGLAMSANNGACLTTPSRLNATISVQTALTLNSAPIASSGVVCTGDTVTLRASGGPGVTYAWSFNSTTGTGATFAAGILSSGTYAGTLTTTNTGCLSGATTVRTFTINVQDAPTITANDSVVANKLIKLCDGDSLQLGTVNSALTYAWNVSGTTSTAPTLNFPIMRTGVYGGRVILTNASANACRAATQVIDFTINVESAPQGISFSTTKGNITTAATSPRNILSVCAGTSNIVITANCPGGTCPINNSGYVWSQDSIGQSITVTVPSTATADVSYIVTLTNSFQCKSIDAIVVRPIKKPFLSIVTSPSSTVCSGSSITFTPDTTGCTSCAGISYLWSPVVVPTNTAHGLQGTAFPVVTAIPTNTNRDTRNLVYRVLATNIEGCQETFTTTVTVNPVWQGTININPITDMCRSDVLTLTSTCTQGCTGVIYNWTNTLNSTVINTQTSSDSAIGITVTRPAISLDTVLNIVLTAQHMNGCVTTINGPGQQRVWRNPNVTLSTNTMPTVGSACPGQAVIATVNTIQSPQNGVLNYNYTWTAGQPIVQPNQRLYSFDSTSVISVVAFYNPVPEITCSTPLTTTITVPALGSMTLTVAAPDKAICLGASTTLTANVDPSFAATSYDWGNLTNNTVTATGASNTITVSPDIKSIYQVTATNANLCKLVLAIPDTVYINYPPSVNIINPGAPLCSGNIIVRSVVTGGKRFTGTGLAPYTYNWTIPSGTPPATTSDSALVVLGPPQPQTVTLTLQVEDANGCVALDTQTVRETGCGALSLQRSLYKDKYCKDDTIRLIANITGGTFGNPTFQWSTGRVRVNTFADTITLNGNLSNDIYSVIVSNGSADFKVIGVKRGYAGSGNPITSIFNAAPNTNNDYHADFSTDQRIGISFDPNGAFLPDPSASETDRGLLMNPALDYSADNALYKSSVATIYLEANTSTGIVPNITGVLIDNKYRANIISQFPATPTNKRYINIQIPCVSSSEPLSLVLETSTGQLKRTAKCIRINATSINNSATPDPLYNTAPIPTVSQAPRVLNILPELLDVQGTNFRSDFVFDISENVTPTGITPGVYTMYNQKVILRTVSPLSADIAIRLSGADIHTFTVPGSSSSLGVGDVSFSITLPLTAPLEFVGAGMVGNVLADDVWGISSTSASQVANVSFSATSLTVPAGYTVSPASVPLTPTYVVTYTSGTLVRGPINVDGTDIRNADINAALNITAPPTTSLKWDYPGVTVASFTSSNFTIRHINSNRDTVGALQFNRPTPFANIPIQGTTATLQGPSIITHVSFSDFFTDRANSETNGTSTVLPAISLDKNSSIVGAGNTGHVCLYQMSPTTNDAKYDRVYISSSPSAVSNLNPSGSAAGAEIIFTLLVENPTIDTMYASLDTICAEDITTIFVKPDSNAISYTWRSTPSAGPIQDTLLATSNVDSIKVGPLSTTRYIVQTTSLYGCKATDSLAIFVNPLPGSRITPNDSIVRFCPSSSATLFAVADSVTCAGNCSYLWEADRNGTWVDVGDAALISRAFDEKLRLTITANGCSDNDQTILEKYPLPEVAIAPDTTLIYGGALRVLCGGAPITLRVDTIISGSNYLWNTSTTFPNLTVNSPGGYYVQVVDNNGCVAISEPVLVINSVVGQNLTVTANPSVICSPTSPAVLSVPACQSCKYTWYRTVSSSRQEVQALSPNRFYNATATGDYFVDITNQYGCTFRSANTYSVISATNASPFITTTTNSLCALSQATLGMAHVPGYQYRWYKDNIVISSQTTNQIVVTTSGTYQLQVFFPNGCSALSNSITIQPAAFLPALDSSGTIICNGSFVTLSTPLLPAAQYQWYLDGVIIAGATGSAFDAVAAGNYYVRVTNQYGCVSNTFTRTLNVSSIATPVATTNKISICPNEFATLSVSLCPGCEYQWFRNGVPSTTLPSASNYAAPTDRPGSYNVRVSTPASGCSQLSNTVVITQKNAPVPSVAAPIRELCGGVNPILQTSSCVGCNYTWLNMTATSPDTVFQPIFGAVNDTVYTVTRLGSYRVQVSYPNGCIVSSGQEIVIDGSFSTSLSSSDSSQICNSSPIVFTATLSDSSRCTGGCSYQWFRNGIPLATTAVSTYTPAVNQRLGGTYQVRVITPSGCISNSNLDTVTAITLAPTITSSAAAICGGTPVSLNITNCPNGCGGLYSYRWSNDSTITSSTITVTASASYVATVSLIGGSCTATTPPVALNPLTSLNTTIGVRGTNGTVTNVPIASICAGDSVRLEQIGGCSACTYQWVRGTTTAFVNVPTATLNNYSTNVPNGYALIANDTSNNCRDTSNFIVLQPVTGYPNFGLNFNGASLAASGSPVDMDTLNPGLTPAALYATGSYSSTPLFAYNPPTVNPGLLATGTRRDTFFPSNALPGNYLITYTYSDSGCVFTTSDVLAVQNAAVVAIDNRNPQHVSYEACVSDTIVITTTNFAFQVNSVQFFNQQDAYTTASIASTTTVATTLAADVIYAQEIRLVIPDWAKGCFVRLVGTRFGGAPDSTTTQFLLIHNEPLALSGLPNTICSNGSPIALTGTPAGGTFLLQRYSANALGSTNDTTAIAGVFAGAILSPSFIPLTQYDSNGIDTMRVVYRFYSKFSNGNFCPQPDTVNSLVVGRAVTLSQVRFNPISVSQTREQLGNLVKRVTPHAASPSRWLLGAPTNGHEVVYGGSFTTPAGAPLEFLPANAGVGMHTLTYTIKNGICQNTVSDMIEVLPLPSQIAIADTICRNIAPITFSRDSSLAYQANSLQFIQPGVTFADTFNTLVVSSADTSRYITVLNPNVGLEQFRYLPRVVDTVLIRDTLLVQYIYSRVEYNNGLPFDTTTYVIASFYQPLFIEDTTLVNILDTLLSPVICENKTDVLVAATPSGGVFTLQGGTGAYAGAGATVVNNILNSFNLHSNETSNTNYVLTYTLNGAACRSRDTFNFLVPKPLNAAFVTASGRRTYCNSALSDSIIASTTGNFTNVLLVNGVAQPTMFFTPTLTTPGPQIVINEVTDTNYGCITSFRDSFHVFPLPRVRIDTFAVREFCTNDSSFQFTIHPAPTCLGATGGERLTQGFNGQVLPAGWNFSNLNPASSGWGQAVLNTLSVAFVDTTSVNQNTWLYTAPVNMVAGSTYQVEYLMRVGPRNCQTCADATMAVTVGQGQNPGAQSTVLATYPTLDDNYAGFYTLQTHSFIASANGNHHFAFHATSAGRTTRWIAIDTVIIREISAGNCLTGIGSITGAGIVNTPGNDSLYTFAPTAMTPGVYTIRYSFSDTRGCVDSIVVPLEVRPHPLVSMSALAPTYCNNDLAVPMSGNPVGGVFTQTRLSGAAGNNMRDLVDTVNNITYNVSVPLRLRPRHVGVERFEYRYRDPLTQCATSVFDTVQVVGIPDSARFLTLVNAPTNPNALRPIYCQSNPAITLNVEPVRGAPLAGIFYGAGVLNGAGGPGVAQINLDSAVLAQGRVGNDTLTYVYTTTNGCRDTTRYVVQIEPLPTLSFDLAPAAQRLPDSICLNDPSRAIRVRHQQFTGPLGTQFIDTMIIFGAGTMTASALQIGDTLNPRAFGAGFHNISYFFRNVHGCQTTIQDSFRVDTVPVIFFTGLPATRSYCENEAGGLLLAYPAYYPGSGYLQLGSRVIDSSFVFIDPAQLADSTQTVVYPIFYTFTNLRGCTSTGRDTIEIRPYPRIVFTLDSVYCNQDDTLDLYTGVTPTGGLFTDNLAVTSIIQGRYLNLNSNAGPRRINYQYTDTLTGCSNAARKTVTLYHTPSVSFIAAGGCQGVDVVYEGALSNLDANFDSLTQVIWNFGDGNSVTMTPTDPILVPDTTHTYTAHGYMQPSLTVVNRGLCSTSVQSNLVVSPTIVLDRYLAPYVEDFETSTGFWYPEQEQVASPTDTVWSHRLLTNGNITDPNNKAWVTHGAQAPYVYGLGDRAHIYSPCFDFSRTWRPMISMDVWRDMNPGVDGAVLEYYDQTARDWKVVGEQNQGVRWYQSNFLLSRPGGQRNTTQPTGWTGISEGWDNVRYRLDQFAGQPSVRFRVAFAAASNTVLIDQPQGFAFDSVWIGERGRNVLVEHFTNYETNDVYFIEQGLYDKIYNNLYGRDVTMIQYHLGAPNTTTGSNNNDQYNNDNVYDNAARSGFYDLRESNRGLIDGFPRGDGTTEAITIRDFDLNMLQFPSFDVFIDPLVINGNDLTVSATVLALKDMPFDEYSVMVVVTEDSLPNQIIDQNSYIYPLMGVMRKLLPDNGGQNYTAAWWQGQNLAVSHSYTMTTPIPSNPAALNGVVFVQNRRTQEVYQVATTRDLTIYAYDSLTTVAPGQPNQVQDEVSNLKLYPNPASNYFDVAFEQPLNSDYQWQLVDVLGRVLQSGTAEAGSRQIQVNTENLSAAPYFFTIRNQSVYTQRQVIITKP